MEVGASVWVRDVDQSWVSSTIISKDDEGTGSCRIVVASGDSRKEFLYRLNQTDGTSDELDGIKLQNDPCEATVEDLINLPYLHEPAILHCLQNRYIGGDIYTYTGPVLIALNPFKSVPLYTPQILESYYNFGLLKSQGILSSRPLPPHVYAVADAAYRDMMRAISQSSTMKTPIAVNQTILISGESGAGKTESTKIVLRYLTTVGNSSGSSFVVTGSVMNKVLQSNPILESFGNARTLRNDNSSRFGKFIELHFSKRGQLIGGTIRTYLLEKVRLAAQQHGERNFHVMYQLIAGCNAVERDKWDLTSAKDYWCCNQGAVFTLRSVDDAEEFSVLRAALKTLNFDDADQQSLFGAVAGLLHLSEVHFVEDGDGCVVSTIESVRGHFTGFARLCGLPEAQLERVLTVRAMIARDDSYDIQLTPGQAVEARDALSKALYSRLFEWIVLRVNESIRVEDASRIRADIGVLDIFGFESFLSNSFEQLCINYTNETLQQQFNQFVFKLEQAEYQKEQISWSFIEFPDNQHCLDLIEHKSNGILAVLDDVCKLGQATDEKFANRLYKLLHSNPSFTANTAQKRDLMFCVTHYAGPVEYLASSFVEKNKNELPKEATSLFRSSTLPLISSIFEESWSPVGAASHATTSPKRSGNAPVSSTAGGAGKVASVSTQFRLQLAELMAKVSSTMPHYIRCLKPNDENVPDKFHRRRTTEQLRYGGVLEAVRVARSGFPVRLSHCDFFARYRCLADPNNKSTPGLPLSLTPKADLSSAGHTSERDHAEVWCKSLLLTLSNNDLESSGAESRDSKEHQRPHPKGGISPDSIQCGLTKVFLRKPAHDILEGRRSRRLRAAASRLQSWYRGYLAFRLYVATLRAVCLVQRIFRGAAARRRTVALRWDRAVLRVQTKWRSSSSVRRYRRFLHALLVLQSASRRKAAKRRTADVALIRNTIRLQRMLRGVAPRCRWRRLLRAIIALQCMTRRRIAKSALRTRRAAAKDLGKLQLSNEALKIEIEQLRARAKDETRRVLAEEEERSTAAAMEELVQLRKDLKAARQELEVERTTSRCLEEKLAVSESDFMKATTQIIDLRGMIATDESEEDEEADWNPPKTPGFRTGVQSPSGGRDARVQRLVTRKARKKTDISHMPSREEFVRASPEDSPDVQGRLVSLDGVWGPKLTPLSPSEHLEGQKHSVTPHTTKPPLRKVSRTAADSSHSGVAFYGDIAPTNTDTEVCIAIFERNLTTMRARLRQGLKVRLWEEGPGCHVYSFECLMTLDRSHELLSFQAASLRRGAFSLFSQRIEVEPIRIADIVDCLSSAGSVREQQGGLLSVFSGMKHDSRHSGRQPPNALTIIVRSQSVYPTRGINATVAGVADTGVRTDTGVGVEAPRVVSLLLPQREDRNFLLSALRTLISIQPERGIDRAGPAAMSTVGGKIASAGLQPTGLNMNNIDEEIKEENKWGEADTDDVADLKEQLSRERTHYRTLVLQVFAHTNDLNDRDEAIVKLKKREACLESMLAANERLHEQDAIVRLQLGKRLEQVLLDKEEAYEELDLFKDKLESIQSAMSIIDFSKSSSITTSSSSSPRS